MRIKNELALDFSDVLIEPKRSTLVSRKDADLTRTFKLLHSGREWTSVPIIAANMDTVATFEMANVLTDYNCLTALHKHYSIDDLIKFFSSVPYGKTTPNNVFYSLGISKLDLVKLAEFKRRLEAIDYLNYSSYCINYCIDVANGYTQTFVDFVKRFRENNPDITLMVGNVVTPEMTEELLLSGADIVKIGIGPGSACTTRKMTGVGYPQLSAVMECADAAHGLKGMICSDGGCTTPGDIAKAFGGGADLVMLGGMLAGHDESGGKIVTDDTIIRSTEFGPRIIKGQPKFMEFYGMSSDTAMEKHNGGVAEYRASEGKTVLIPYRGAVKNTIQEILGGIRSTCLYTGSASLKELTKRTTFIRVNNQLNNVFTGKETK